MDAYREQSAAVKCIVDWYGPTDIAKMNYYPSSMDHTQADSPEGFVIGRKNVLENPELARCHGSHELSFPGKGYAAPAYHARRKRHAGAL